METVQPDAPARRSFFSRWGYFVLIAIVILITLIAGVLLYRESQIAGLPDIGDPFDVAAFTSLTLPDEQNAAPDYVLALSLMKEPRVPFGNREPNLSMAKGWSGASENVRLWVMDNQPALDAMRRGSVKPDIDGLVNREGGLERVSDLRDLCRIAQLDISRIATKQNPAETWEANLALIRYALHIGKRGTVIARLVSNAVHHVGVACAADWVHSALLDEALLREALGDVVKANQLAATAEETLRWEYVEMSRLAKTDFADDVDFDRKAQLFLKHEPELGQRVMQHDAAISFAGLHRLPTAADVLADADLDRFARKTVWGRTLRDSASHLDLATRLDAANRRSLEFILAAHIYHRMHGEFPTEAGHVSEILKSTGSETPIDPFSRSGEFLKFRVEGKRFIVWSLGPNEVDDSGREPDDRTFGHEETPE